MATKSINPAAKTTGKPATAKNAFPKKPRINRWKVQPDGDHLLRFLVVFQKHPAVV